MADSRPSSALQFRATLRRTVWVPIIGAFVMSCLLLWQIQTLRDATFWADHSDEVLAQANLVERLMVDGESGLRGLLLLHDEKFLEPYLRSREATPSAYQLFSAMVADNPEQHSRVDALKELSEDWFSAAGELISSVAHPSSVAITELSQSMEQIRQRFDAIVDNEERLRQKRNERVDATVGRVFVTSVSLLLAFAVFVSLRTRRTLMGLSHSYGQLISESNTALKNLKTVNDVGSAIAGELKLDALVQRVTDAATEAVGAKFGAFFYNVTNEKGESYSLYSLSGVPKDSFARFPMPRNTALFKPTFEGLGIVRSDDIKKDPRYGQSEPHHGPPPGHLPVTSYLAVPVLSRSGEVFGGLFFGHPEEARFTSQHEEIVAGLAAQASVGIDNATLYKRAQDAVKLRDEFLSIASHELKTPLTSLMLQLQLGRRAVDESGGKNISNDKIGRIFHLCLHQMRRLVTLVDDLLDVSRIQAGRLAYQFEYVNLSEIVAEAGERFVDQFTAEGSKLNTQIEPGLHVWCDRFRIDQVVANLLSNALKYGEGQPVDLALSRDKTTAVISVTDHGGGIAADKQHLIFELYERAVGSANISGLGLGLYISKQIVSAHDGEIIVKSENRQGAQFQVRLPLKPKSKQGDEA